MDINVFYEIMVCLIDTMNTHKLHNFKSINLYFTSINNQVRYRINVRFKILNTSLVNILYFFLIIVIFYTLSYNVISSE